MKKIIYIFTIFIILMLLISGCVIDNNSTNNDETKLSSNAIIEPKTDNTDITEATYPTEKQTVIPTEEITSNPTEVNNEPTEETKPTEPSIDKPTEVNNEPTEEGSQVSTEIPTEKDDGWKLDNKKSEKIEKRIQDEDVKVLSYSSKNNRVLVDFLFGDSKNAYQVEKMIYDIIHKCLLQDISDSDSIPKELHIRAYDSTESLITERIVVRSKLVSKIRSKIEKERIAVDDIYLIDKQLVIVISSNEKENISHSDLERQFIIGKICYLLDYEDDYETVRVFIRNNTGDSIDDKEFKMWWPAVDRTSKNINDLSQIESILEERYNYMEIKDCHVNGQNGYETLYVLFKCDDISSIELRSHAFSLGLIVGTTMDYYNISRCNFEIIDSKTEETVLYSFIDQDLHHTSILHSPEIGVDLGSES